MGNARSTCESIVAAAAAAAAFPVASSGTAAGSVDTAPIATGNSDVRSKLIIGNHCTASTACASRASPAIIAPGKPEGAACTTATSCTTAAAGSIVGSAAAAAKPAAAAAATTTRTATNNTCAAGTAAAASDDQSVRTIKCIRRTHDATHTASATTSSRTAVCNASIAAAVKTAARSRTATTAHVDLKHFASDHGNGCGNPAAQAARTLPRSIETPLATVDIHDQGRDTKWNGVRLNAARIIESCGLGCHFPLADHQKQHCRDKANAGKPIHT